VPEVAREPGDAVTSSLLPIYQQVFTKHDSDEQRVAEMIAEERVLVTFRPQRLHGVLLRSRPVA